MSKEVYGEDYPRIARIECLHLHNFKSFKGDHVVGPFLNLTAIVGPNGSGKSNVLDAISYILAIRTTHMREGNLKQFVYRAPGEEVGDTSATKAWVVMDFAPQSGPKLKFKRVLNAKGFTHYYLDEEQVSHEEYVRELERHKLLAQTRAYFLVMQGEIDGILQNSSKELTRVIEEISGSKEYKAQYEELKAALEQSQQQITAISKNLQELRGEKRKAKGVKANVEAFEKARERAALLQTELYATMCAFYEKKVRELEQRVEELEEDVQKQSEEKDVLVEKQQQTIAALDKLTRDETGLERDRERLKEQRLRNVKNLRRLEGKAELCTKELQAKTTAKEALRTKLAEQERQAQNLATKLKEREEEYARLEEEMERAENQGCGSKYRDEYYELKHEVEARTFDIKSEVQKLSAHRNVSLKRVQTLESRLVGARKQLEGLNGRLDELGTDALKLEIERTTKAQQECQGRFSALSDQLRERRQVLADLEMELAGEEYELKKLEHEHEFKLQRGREYHLIEQLTTKVRGCRGLLIQLVNACEKKYEVAVKVGLGKYLTHLVVDDESAAASCNISLKDAGVMKDILILSNVPRKTATNSPQTLSTLASLGAIQLVDAIEYNGNVKKLKEAVMHIAGRKVICDNLFTAKALRKQGVKDVITQNGEVLKQGVITGGHNEHLLGLEFQQRDYNQKHNDAKEKVDNLKHAIAEHKADMQHQQFVECKEQLDALVYALSHLHHQLKQMEGEHDQVLQEVADVTELTFSLEEEKKKAELKAGELEVEIAENKKAIGEVEGNTFRDFCAKLKIAKISEYEGTDLPAANEFHTREMQLVETIEQLKAQIELLQAHKLKEKLARVEDGLQELERSQKESQQELQDEQKKGGKIEEEYEAIGKALEAIELQRKIQTTKQKAIEDEVRAVIGVIDETKKQLITSLCQIKNNARLKIRTIDELKLKNIPVSLEPITRKEAMLAKGMDVDYKVDYEKYDIDMSIVTSKDLEGKEKSLLESITVEEKKIADFNALALMKGDEGDDLGQIDREIEKERKALEAVSKEHEKHEKTFRQVKDSRRQAFKSCYEQLSTYIDTIYQELTRTEDTGFMYGGHAILVPENVAEPYNGEIQYAPTPPGKRVVYELEQLSGGEKALAALGLILAVQKYQKSPLLVLDEVDAHLDIKNVKRLAEFLHKTVQDSEFQCIVVSHKETLAEMFDSLLGVAHSKAKQSSVVYSLDLRPFA